MASGYDEPGALRAAATELSDAFQARDIAGLLQLTEAGREQQENIRQQLAMYIEQRFDETDPRLGGDGGRSREVAGAVRDIVQLLWGNARAAQRQAGDLDG